MQIHKDFKKVILSQKSDRLPPREVGPEETQNVDQKQIRVFHVFRLGG